MFWLNGEFVENAQVDATSAGFLVGWGNFTTIGVQNGRPIFLSEHLQRLRRDAQICGIDLTFDDSVIKEATLSLINKLAIETGVARITLTKRGDNNWNHNTGSDLLIQAQSRAKAPIYGLKALLFWGIAPDLGGVKTTSYWPYLRAFAAAKEEGCDEALLLGHDKFLVEGARSNLFFIKEGAVFTPSLQTGALRGVGREIVLEWAKNEHLLIKSGQFQLQDLLSADETFIISGATGPRELAKLREPSGSETQLGGAGPIFGLLRRLWDSQ
jgi:branched-chain amino acid aminotransferase